MRREVLRVVLTMVAGTMLVASLWAGSSVFVLALGFGVWAALT